MIRTKTQLITQIQFTELVQVTTVEARLKKNFELIVEEFKRKNQFDAKRDEDIKNLYNLVNTMAVNNSNTLKKEDFDNSLKGFKEEMMKEISKAQQKFQNQIEMKSKQDKAEITQNVSSLRDQLNSLEKKLKENKNSLSDLSKELGRIEQSIMKQVKKSISTTQDNSKSLIDQSKFQASMDSMNSKFDELAKQVDRINEENLSRDSKLSQHSDDIYILNKKIQSMESTFQKFKKESEKNTKSFQTIDDQLTELLNFMNINLDLKQRLQRLQELNSLDHQNIDKQIQQLYEELNRLLNDLAKKQEKEQVKLKTERQEELVFKDQSLRKQLLCRIHEQRKQYMHMFKTIKQQKTLPNTDASQQYPHNEQLTQIRFLITKKADQESTKKALFYIQKKLNYVMNAFLGLAGDGDARVGKTKWLCLSCDRSLTNFTGKVGEHIPKEGLKGKKLETVSKINYESQRQADSNQTPRLRYKSRSKLQLPTVGSVNATMTLRK